MRIKSNYVAAAGIALAVALYFFVRGGVDASSRALEALSPTVEVETEEDLGLLVVVERPERELHIRQVTLNGRTEAARVVTVRAEVAGTVEETLAHEGDEVAQGDPLCRVSVEARAARLAEARARLASRDLELTAAQELAERGHRSANQVAVAQAAYDAADAALAQANIEMENTVLRAPFAGVFDERLAEIGDYLSVGGACGVVAEVDPILVTAQAAERAVRFIHVGDQTDVLLTTGETLHGVVRFVQFRADPATRTFRIEIEAPNVDGLVRAGLSADIRLQGTPREAARIPSGVLTLNDDGLIGVRILDAEDIVRFVPIDIIEDTPTGIWAAGIPADARVIVRGQNFVVEGRKARAAADARG